MSDCEYMIRTYGIELCDNNGVLCVCILKCPYYPKKEIE